MPQRFFFFPKLVLVLFFGCAISSLLPAQPRLAVSKGSLVHDYGNVEHGQKLEYRLVLKNTGNATAHLGEISRTCGKCGPMSASRTEVPPDADVTLTSTVNTGQTVGKQKLVYLLRLNDPQSSNGISLTIHWNVKPFLRVQPQEILFQKEYSTFYDCEIQLHSEGTSTTARILNAKCSSPHVTLGKIGLSTDKKVSTLPVRIAPTAPAGDFIACIILQTNHPQTRTLNVPIKGTISSPFHLDQLYLNFGIVPQGITTCQSLNITIPPNVTAKVTGLKYDKKILECIPTTQTSTKYCLRVNLLPRSQEGLLRTSITLLLDSPIQPSIQVPVIARCSKKR